MTLRIDEHGDIVDDYTPAMRAYVQAPPASVTTRLKPVSTADDGRRFADSLDAAGAVCGGCVSARSHAARLIRDACETGAEAYGHTWRWA